jgi:tRNA threonylcarbamoyladenosine biosynthesis protein TsaB
MANIICIETATINCSVALIQNNSVLAFKESTVRNSHAEMVTVFIEELLAENNVDLSALNAVAVSKGPGSYTGLRIGVSTAKGLCYALDIPLLAVSTLEVLTSGIIKDFSVDESVLFCPMIDARRMEVYSAVYNIRFEQLREIKAEIINKHSFHDLLDKGRMVFLGDGSLKCKEVIDHPNAVFSYHIYPSAQHMAAFASNAFSENRFEDVAYFEPYYLKDFVPGIPKVKGLK